MGSPMNTALQHINSHVPKESRRMTTILKNTTAVNADGSMKTIVITDDPVPVEDVVLRLRRDRERQECPDQGESGEDNSLKEQHG